MANNIERMIADTFMEMAHGLETGSFGKRPKVALTGMGSEHGEENSMKAAVEAAKDGPFLSKDDFRQRTKVSKSVIDLMGDLGILGNLPESNQLSLFDF